MQALVRVTESGTLGEGWRRYALTGRGAAAGVANGMTVFMQGRLWQMSGEGAALVLRDGHAFEAGDAKGRASIVNSWL